MKSRYNIWVLSLLLVAGGGLMAQMKEKTSKRGWLGVSIQDVTERIVKKYKLPSDEGAFISDVSEDSPADSAGLREGDVIVTFAGKSIYDADDLTKQVQKLGAGTRSEVVIVRDGSRKTVSVTLGRQKNSGMAFAVTAPSMPRMKMMMGNHTLGLELSTLNEQLGTYFGAPNNEGVLVEAVAEEGAGAKAGFLAGDVIIKFGKRNVSDVGDIMKELSKADEGDKIAVDVLRKGSRKSVTVEVEEDEENGHIFFRDHGAGMNFFPQVPGHEFEYKMRSLPDEARVEIQRGIEEARRNEIMLKRDINEDVLRKVIRLRSSTTTL